MDGASQSKRLSARALRRVTLRVLDVAIFSLELQCAKPIEEMPSENFY
jgi:hypothetical protein